MWVFVPEFALLVSSIESVKRIGNVKFNVAILYDAHGNENSKILLIVYDSAVSVNQQMNSPKHQTFWKV